MSIDKRNLALPAIMAVATMIVMNAVVGQDGKHPAPIGDNGQHQKISKSKTPIVKSKYLKRKSNPVKTAVVSPRTKPKNANAKSKGDGIGQLLKAVGNKEKNTTLVAAKSLEDKKVRFVQTRLAELGYSPGPVDGVFGQKTRDAIEEFENDRQIPITGEISRALIKALSRRASFASLKIT